MALNVVILNKAILQDTERLWEERLFIHQPVYNRRKCEEKRKERKRKRGQIFQHLEFIFITNCGKNNEHHHNQKMYIWKYVQNSNLYSALLSVLGWERSTQKNYFFSTSLNLHVQSFLILVLSVKNYTERFFSYTKHNFISDIHWYDFHFSLQNYWEQMLVFPTACYLSIQKSCSDMIYTNSHQDCLQMEFVGVALFPRKRGLH